MPASSSSSTFFAAAALYMVLSPLVALHRSRYVLGNSLLAVPTPDGSRTGTIDLQTQSALLVPQRAHIDSLQQVSGALAILSSTGLLHLAAHSLFVALVHAPLLATATYSALRALFPSTALPAQLPIVAMLLDLAQGAIVVYAAAYFPQSMSQPWMSYLPLINSLTWYAVWASALTVVLGAVYFVTAIGRDGRQKVPAAANKKKAL
ncbi:hypothetical protein RI367_004164 [Sorochytrium milnesiophthora]